MTENTPNHELDAPESDQALRERAEQPKRARGDEGEVEQHSLREQIELDRYLASKRAATRRASGLRITKMVPPGADG